MTACVNNQNENKGGVSHKVLRSVVAGVLAVSMVPTAALAAEPGNSYAVTGNPSAYTGENSTIHVGITGGNAYASNNTLFLVKDGVELQNKDISSNDGNTAVDFAETVLQPGNYDVVYSDDTKYENSDDVVAEFTVSSNASGQYAWDSNTFKYTVDPVGFAYTVEQGYSMAVESVTDVHGNLVDPSDYTVVYLNSSDQVTSKTTDRTLDLRDGGMPGKDGTYKIAVIEGRVDAADITSGKSIATLAGANAYHVQEFTVAPASSTISDVFAFETDGTVESEGSSALDAQLADTSFQYNGGTVNVSLAMGKKVLSDSDVKVEWTQLPVGAAAPQLSGNVMAIANAQAGTYTAKVTGIGSYKGTAEVSFEIKGIDLGSDAVTIAPIVTSSGNGVMEAAVLKDNYITVNGSALSYTSSTVSSDVVATLESACGVAATGAETDMATAGKYVFKLTAAPGSKNVTGTKTVTAYAVTNLASYTYDAKAVTSYTADSPLACDPELNVKFDPEKIAATADANPVGYTYAVYSVDGGKVTSWTEPGLYRVVLDTPVADGYAYAGHAEFYFLNAAPTKVYDSPQVMFTSIDGKNHVSGASVPYDGEAIVPTVTVKAGTDKLVAGEDYTLVYTLNGQEVSEIKDPGSYTIKVTLNDTAKTVMTSVVNVTKAPIVLIEPAADFFSVALDGTAAAPSFVGYTNADKAKAQKFDLSADDLSVTYERVTKWTDSNDNGKLDASEVAGATTEDVKADELTEGGYYLASVNIKSTAKYLAGTCDDVVVLVSEKVSFTDVDANEWYAEPVYAAKDFGYINGIQGTNLFAPEASIERCAIAGIMFNMSGGTSDTVETSYTTKFSDVVPNAWYAKAVAWASEMGVVNGYAGTDLFGTHDKATREEVAGMFYNLAKAKGQDVSVADEDAALAKVKDADTVSPWFKTAVAWAVENGVMGNGGYIDAKSDITRAEVAAIAVNFQPNGIEKLA